MNSRIDTGDELRELLGGLLGMPADALDEHSSLDNVAAWDSLAHLTIVLAIESEYGVSVSAPEALRLRSVGEIRRYLAARGVA
jgi:acyl carrier protein